MSDAKTTAAKCRGCGAPLLPENALADDGCPCNSARGLNWPPMPCAICRVDDCVKPAHRATTEEERAADRRDCEGYLLPERGPLPKLAEYRLRLLAERDALEVESARLRSALEKCRTFAAPGRHEGGARACFEVCWIINDTLDEEGPR